VAKIVRTDLLGLTPSPGSSLLTQTAPSAQTTISSYTFPWAQGLVLNHATITGKDLLNNYPQTYGKGYLLGAGVNEGWTTQSLNTNM
jgi:hypothetical protein